MQGYENALLKMMGKAIGKNNNVSKMKNLGHQLVGMSKCRNDVIIYFGLKIGTGLLLFFVKFTFFLLQHNYEN